MDDACQTAQRYLDSVTRGAASRSDVLADVAQIGILAAALATVERIDQLNATLAELKPRRVEQVEIEVAALRQQLAERDEQYQQVMNEACAPDEHHCTCVPHLRHRIKELTQALEGCVTTVDAGTTIRHTDPDVIRNARNAVAEQRINYSEARAMIVHLLGESVLCCPACGNPLNVVTDGFGGGQWDCPECDAF